MTQTDTIEVAVDNETENYAVYESADEDTIVGMYVSEGAAEAIGEFGSVTLSEDADVTADKNKDTANYGVYETAGGAISGMYVSHDALESEESDDGPIAPSEIGLTIAPSDEETFEAQTGVDEAEEEALVSADSEDTSDEEDEELDVADEELGLVDN